MRRVIITAMLGPWKGEKLPGDILIGINRTGDVEPRLDRLYCFDADHLFSPDHVEYLNKLDIPIFTRDRRTDIPLAARYPRAEIVEYFNGLTFSTCTVAWILQHVIYEHCKVEQVDQLILANMYYADHSREYLGALPCVNFWIGMALGLGINVVSADETAVVRPMPWESAEYGYSRNTNSRLCAETLAAAYTACLAYPQLWVKADDDVALPDDIESLQAMRDHCIKVIDEVDEKMDSMELEAVNV